MSIIKEIFVKFKHYPILPDFCYNKNIKQKGVFGYMSKGITTLADMRREKQYKNLMKMPDRDLCELVRAHFESHPTLPGEKVLKDEVNQRLNLLEASQMTYETEQTKTQNETTQAIRAAKYDPVSENGFEPATKTPFDKDPDIFTTIAEKENIAQKYAQTRIRETSFDGLVIPAELNCSSVTEISQNNSKIYVSKVDAELQRSEAGTIYVLAEQSNGTNKIIGTLPEKFVTNNPMNVDSCSAEIQIADYSNGKEKNLSTKIVVDTDLMSGDVIELDEDMLTGLDQETGLEQ